jgi:hypothetical protein
MKHYNFRTYKNETFTLEDLSPEEAKNYKKSIISTIKEISETNKIYELGNGKVLAQLFYGGSSVLFPSKAVFEHLEEKAVFLKLGEKMQLIGFQLLDAEDLTEVDGLISQTLGNSCEGETFLLSSGQVYTREDYRRHGYIFMNIDELNLYCTEWINKDPLTVVVAVTSFR